MEFPQLLLHVRPLPLLLHNLLPPPRNLLPLPHILLPHSRHTRPRNLLLPPLLPPHLLLPPNHASKYQ